MDHLLYFELGASELAIAASARQLTRSPLSLALTTQVALEPWLLLHYGHVLFLSMGHLGSALLGGAYNRSSGSAVR